MNNKTLSRRLEIQLMVDHPKLKAAELKALLKLSADQYWDVGQSYKPSPSTPEQHYTFSRWAIKVMAGTLDNLTNAIHQLIHRIQSIEKNFLLLPSDATVSLTLFVTENDTVLGMGFDAETIHLLARIKAGIEVSLVINQPSNTSQ
jgi:hypothetical protein